MLVRIKPQLWWLSINLFKLQPCEHRYAAGTFGISGTDARQTATKRESPFRIGSCPTDSVSVSFPLQMHKKLGAGIGNSAGVKDLHAEGQ
jgi:hypothetical protein